MPRLDIEEYNVEVNVLGLRSLVSTGLLPIRKAYIKFSVKSVLPPAQAKAVSDIFTEPGEGGSDPNIRTTLKILVRIPANEEYCPRMTCTAYDKLYFEGMTQPILGSFTLKLGDILGETRAADKLALDEFGELRERLEEVLRLKQGEKSHETVLAIVNDLVQGKGTSGPDASPMGGQDGKGQIHASDIDLEAEDLEAMTAEEREEHERRAAAKQKRAAEREAWMQKAAAKQAALEEERRKAADEMAANKEAARNVIYPVTKFHERLKVEVEVDQPASTLFLPVGYNREPKDGKKHYRRFYPDELENIAEVMQASPFLAEKIFRMEQKDAGWFGGGSDDSQNNAAVECGTFKGLVKVYN